jgi:predicted Ser/Thr protein kinase
MDLVRMPYLRSYQTERLIYDEHLRAGGLQDEVVPHATMVLALWAVLTRLKKPQPELYPVRIRDVVARLSPMEKAELYATGKPPRELSAEQTREVLATLPEIIGEGQDSPDAEGLSGASPREMKQVLLNALQGRRHWGLSTLGIVDELREHIKLKSVYDYLQVKRDHGYHDHEGFVEQVYDRWMELVDGELRHAMGMVDEQKYEGLFARYLLNVSYAQKNEKLYNDKTGNYDPPDAKLMGELERTWEVPGDAERFRRDLVSRVGAWRVEHPGEKIPWRRLFPKLIDQLEQDYYAKQKQRVQRQLELCMTMLGAEQVGEDPAARGLGQADLARTREVLAQLVTRHGYPRPSLREVLSALMKHRY